jgi:hypothetical protein
MKKKDHNYVLLPASFPPFHHPELPPSWCWRTEPKNWESNTQQPQLSKASFSKVSLRTIIYFNSLSSKVFLVGYALFYFTSLLPRIALVNSLYLYQCVQSVIYQSNWVSEKDKPLTMHESISFCSSKLWNT